VGQLSTAAGGEDEVRDVSGRAAPFGNGFLAGSVVLPSSSHLRGM
jgi:hypothetical protein